jgi:hypothetical protein
LAGLRGQAAEITGVITAASLKSYLYQNMAHFLTDDERANPDISKEPYVLDQTNPTAPMTFTQIAVAEVTRVKVRIHVAIANVGKAASIFGNDASTPIESVQNAPNVWEVDLPKGLYEVRLASGASQLIKVDPSLESQDVRFS